MIYKPIILLILDGFGLSNDNPQTNPIKTANKPNFEYIGNHFPGLALQASGLTVGVPWGVSGNSEVGHTAIGAGRFVAQELSRINASIETGNFYNFKIWDETIKWLNQNNSDLHLLGLVSTGGVHAHINHLLTLLEMLG